MNSAYLHLLHWAIGKGLYVSIWREGTFDLQRSRNVNRLKQALEWAEESKVVIYERVETNTQTSTDFSGWNYLMVGTAWVNCFLEPEETVYDFETGLLEDWLYDFEHVSSNSFQAIMSGEHQNLPILTRTL